MHKRSELLTSPLSGPSGDPAVRAQRRKATMDRASATGCFVHASVANEIGQMIVRGDYAPGTILPNEAEWSARFGASRSVVREAIKMLTAKNLLASRPKIGSRVQPRDRWNHLDRDILTWSATTPHGVDLMRSVQEFRAIIEPEAAALAAAPRSDADMALISAACAEMGAAPTLILRTAADRRFHQAILKAAGNELIMPRGAMIDAALDHLFTFVTRQAKDLRHAQGLHEDIERCIRLRRPDAARRAVKVLLANTDQILARSPWLK